MLVGVVASDDYRGKAAASTGGSDRRAMDFTALPEDVKK
jgi:hypothetical protein